MEPVVRRKTLKKPRKLKKKLVIVEALPSPTIIKKSSVKDSKMNVKIASEAVVPSGKVYNEEFTKLLGELHSIMTAKGEYFRARAYKQAQEAVMAFPGDITSVSQLKGIKGIGEIIMKKLNEYVTTGTLKLLERERANPVLIFTNVYGIGPKKAEELVKKHKITTIAQLRENEDLLNDKQKIGLKYYEAILERIPRAEIDEYAEVYRSTFDEVKTPGSTMEIVGSYRRGAKDSGDIDIIVGNKQGDVAVFNAFLDALAKKDLIVEFLSRGKVKSLVIGQLPGKKPRRVDFLFSPPEEYAFAVLYFTGSAVFNTVMRQHALKLGYSMNEHGLYKMIAKKKGEKLDILFPDEKSIFAFLGLEYKTPVERKNGTAVVVVGGKEDAIAAPAPVAKAHAKKPAAGAKKTLKKPKKHTKKTVKAQIELFQKEGIDALHGMDVEMIAAMLRLANDAYYNKSALLTDSQYDIIKEYMETKHPGHKVLDEIGAPIEKNKVKLPYFMGSMDKIKPDTGAVHKWVARYKGPYLLSTKLDGISGLYTTEGETPKLYTRGNGEYGQDITHLIPYLDLPKEKGLTIRGEIIMSKKVFTTKYTKDWSNARNLVSGIVNAKTRDADKLKDVDFVAYELIHPEMSPIQQYEFLKKTGVTLALHDVKKSLSNEMLSETLLAWRDGYDYEIDGVIVTNDAIYPRKKGNPDYAFAFKMVLSDQVVEAKVVDVLWTPSKDGYLKPRIRIEPVVIGGATIEYATAFNGGFVEEQKIGIGAVIQLVRSGDVIPHIMAVLTPAPEAKMPDVPYVWNDTHVDVMLEDKDSDEIVRQKNITGFFQAIDVVGLGPGNVKKIMKAGFDSVPAILAMSVEDFTKADGFKAKMAAKVHTSIHDRVDKVPLTRLMYATNIFGRGMGEKRIQTVLDAHPDILLSPEENSAKVAKIKTLSGFAAKTAQAFVSHIDAFVDFMKKAGMEGKIKEASKGDGAAGVGGPSVKKDTGHPIFGKQVVFSGFRDKDLSAQVVEAGGEVVNSLTKKTFALIVKDVDDETGKTEKAKAKGIPIQGRDEFEKKYFGDK